MPNQSFDSGQAIFALLSGATCVLSLVLSRILRDVVAILRRRERRGTGVSRSDVSVPEFEGMLLGSGLRFTNYDFVPPPGELASLVFLKPLEFASDRMRMRHIVNRIHRDTPGRVYVVCMDSVSVCAAVHNEVFAGSIPTLADSNGVMSRTFRVRRRASAVYVNSDGLIVRRGNEVRAGDRVYGADVARKVVRDSPVSK